MGMTVKQLKLALERFPEETLVLVHGYEGGFSDIQSVEPVKVKLNCNEEEWYGPHENVQGSDTDAILLFRAPNPNANK